MTEDMIISGAIWIALALLAVSFLLTAWRVVAGPTLGDRVVALDMLVGIAIGFIAVIAVKTGFTLYIDVAIALGLVGFLATVAFARFILSRRSADEEGQIEMSIRNPAGKPPQRPASKPGPNAKGRPGGSGRSARGVKR